MAQVKHILRERLILNWQWGPLTSYKMDLEDIDSAGATGNDVMELVAHLASKPWTQKLLLDDFMQGFLHALFLQKWDKYARRMHWAYRLLDVVYLAQVIYMGFYIAYI